MPKQFVQYHFVVTRRSLLRMLFATSFTAIFRDYSYSHSHKSEIITVDILKKFQDWSHIATGFSDITLDEAQEYLKFCLKNGIKLKDLDQLESSVYKGTPLEKKLLEGWMTGLVHLHGTETDRHYDAMLMWRAAGLDVKPLSCQHGPRAWSLAPLGQ